MSRRLIIFLAVLIPIIVICSYFAVQILYQNDKKILHVSVSQSNASIMINGRQVQSGDIYLKPGKYILSVNKSGYYEYRKIITIDKDNVSFEISPTAEPDRAVEAFELGDAGYKKLVVDNLIISKLPYEDPLYKIDYTIYGSIVNGYSIRLTISSTTASSRRMAIQEIRGLGFNPIDYKVDFLSFKSEIQ